MQQTVRFLKTHNIWNVVFWILTPLPGTDLCDEMTSSNRVTDYDWAKYDLNHVVFQPKQSSPDELYRSFWSTYKSMYTLGSVYQRVRYTLKISKKSTLNSLLNQFYTLQQIRKMNHPYSMGIWKRN